jgi:hypothetical protein
MVTDEALRDGTRRHTRAHDFAGFLATDRGARDAMQRVMRGMHRAFSLSLLVLAAACSAADPGPISSTRTAAVEGDGRGGSDEGNALRLAPPSEVLEVLAPSGPSPVGNGTSNAPPSDCSHGAIMWDTDPTIAPSLCPATGDDCIVCAQCTDREGHATRVYVVPQYPRACGCPYEANDSSLNCPVTTPLDAGSAFAP